MQIPIPKEQLADSDRLVRRLGYALHLDRKTGHKSFVRRLAQGMFFPRFHLYVEATGDSGTLNLHLDQRAPIYEGVTAHSGEYDGDVVEREVERIRALLSQS